MIRGPLPPECVGSKAFGPDLAIRGAARLVVQQGRRPGDGIHVVGDPRFEARTRGLEEGAGKEVRVGIGERLQLSDRGGGVPDRGGKAQDIRLARQAQSDPGSEVRIPRLREGGFAAADDRRGPAVPAGELGEGQPGGRSSVTGREPRDGAFQEIARPLDLARVGEPLAGGQLPGRPTRPVVVRRQPRGGLGPARRHGRGASGTGGPGSGLDTFRRLAVRPIRGESGVATAILDASRRARRGARAAGGRAPRARPATRLRPSAGVRSASRRRAVEVRRPSSIARSRTARTSAPSSAPATDSTVGDDIAATTNNTSRSPSDSRPSRSPRSAAVSVGIGSGSPAIGQRSRRASSRAISMASKGLPRDAASRRTSCGRLKRRSGPLAHEVVKDAQADRADFEVAGPLAERGGDPRSHAGGRGCPDRCQEPDRQVVRTPKCELERRGRCRVDPLDVVERQQDGAIGGCRTERAEDRRADGARIGHRTRGPAGRGSARVRRAAAPPQAPRPVAGEASAGWPARPGRGGRSGRHRRARVPSRWRGRSGPSGRALVPDARPPPRGRSCRCRPHPRGRGHGRQPGTRLMTSSITASSSARPMTPSGAMRCSLGRRCPWSVG